MPISFNYFVLVVATVLAIYGLLTINVVICGVACGMVVPTAVELGYQQYVESKQKRNNY